MKTTCKTCNAYTSDCKCNPECINCGLLKSTIDGTGHKCIQLPVGFANHCFDLGTPVVEGYKIINVNSHDITMPSKENKEWIEKMRELYLVTSPDEKGLYTKTITFNWAEFIVAPKEKQIEFYLTTKESMEKFIDSLLSQAEQQGYAKGRAEQGGEVGEWEKEFDSMFDWADQIKERELGHWKIMYGFLPKDLKLFKQNLLKKNEERVRVETLEELLRYYPNLRHEVESYRVEKAQNSVNLEDK